MRLTPALIERLSQIAQAARAAVHGGRQAIYAAACQELGVSRSTLHRALKRVSVAAPRKRRSDAGQVSLSMDEAQRLSAYLVESQRKNGKRLASIEQAVAVLRANGLIRAERQDPATGQALPLSVGAICRALRRYALHPDQLLQPAPAVQLRSLHPNHVWQIDASLCVLYYLRTEDAAQRGLQVMEASRFYKNKPANVASIEHDRVWSYEVTDHASGVIFVHYVLGGESATNLAQAFMAAIQPRSGDPFHGVPFIVMADRGSANTSALFRNLLRRLQVQLLLHAPGNARATGQVEKARDIIERSFESGLRFQAVDSLAQLNERAQAWAVRFNGEREHGRHGLTRYAAWLHITPQQLRLAPPPEVCRALLTHAPQARTVNAFLQVDFMGRVYDVRAVPGVMVGERLQLAINPYEPDCATVVDVDGDGHETLRTVPLVQRDAYGFPVTANVIGSDYARATHTQADTNRQAIEQVATQTATPADARAARKRKVVPFGGQIDPFKPTGTAAAPTWLPRRGTALVMSTKVAGTALPPAVLDHFQAARELARRGVAMNPQCNALVASWYPAGVPEDEIGALQERLERALRPSLRVVGGRSDPPDGGALG